MCSGPGAMLPGRMLRWGILSTGEIAHAWASAMGRERPGAVVAVAGRSGGSAEAFGATHGIPRRYAGYDALLADPGVDAVYVGTIHPLHAEWTIRAAQAGKHVLCEKPLAMTAAEAEAMAAAAEQAGVALLEAFAYRHTAQILRLLELLRTGAIGELRLIEAAFSFAALPRDPAGRLLDPALGGGGILDVGCYPVDLARRVVGAAWRTAPPEPLDVLGIGHLGDTGVDEWAAALLRFDGGVLAQLTCGVGLDHPGGLRLLGSDGELSLAAPFDGAGPEACLTLTRRGAAPETIAAPGIASPYALEADALESLAADPAGRPQARAEAVANMRVLDRWRAQLGLRYPGEPVPGS